MGCEDGIHSSLWRGLIVRNTGGQSKKSLSNNDSEKLAALTRLQGNVV
jgi:hypothetical protein